MKKKQVLVIGSTNTDMVVKTERFPVPGETILGGHFLMVAGGKGANQAVAAKRMGGDVVFVGKTGDDVFGKQAVQLLEDEGIITEHMVMDKSSPSGAALITINREGENTIVVAAGANGTLVPEDFVPDQVFLESIDIVLFQLETPIDSVVYWVDYFKKLGKRVILNPAPAQNLPDTLYRNLYLLTPNESETELILGEKIGDDEKSLYRAAKSLHNMGIENVIITLGAAGAYIMSEEYTGRVAAPVVKAVDTTAAGDTFNGALAVFLSEGMGIVKAVELACRAASISVTRMGAQTSIPMRDEINL